MTAKRVIDTDRAAGIADAAPKRILGSELMSVEDAEEHVERVLGWRTVLGPSDQASLALLREVRRLRDANSSLARDALAGDGQAMELSAELARIRAASPEAIGCVGDALHCTCDSLDGGACCERRLRLIADGLLLQPDHQEQAHE